MCESHATTGFFLAELVALKRLFLNWHGTAHEATRVIHMFEDSV